MLDEKVIWDRINVMLGDSEYPMEIKDVEELEEFLNDSGNMSLGIYDEIEQLYNQLLGYDEITE